MEHRRPNEPQGTAQSTTGDGTLDSAGPQRQVFWQQTHLSRISNAELGWAGSSLCPFHASNMGL